MKVDLNQLEKTNMLSSAGKNWLTLAIDPFHDTEISVAGMPDHDVGDTVVQLLKKQLTIRKPVGVDGNWDCHVTTLPILTGPSPVVVGNLTLGASSYFVNQNSINDAYTTTVVSPVSQATRFELGTITVVTTATGEDTFPSVEDFNPSQQNPYNAFGHNEYFKIDALTTGASAQAKIIAGGFEVHNDTAVLNKQGNVTVYNSPQSRNDTTLKLFTVSETSSFVNADVYRQPPSNKQDAVLIPNSKTWTAEQGCLVPFIMDPDHSTFAQSRDAMCMFRYEEESYPTQFYSYNGTAVGAVQEVGVSAVPYIPGGNPGTLGINNYKPAALSSTGAYFSGLSPETVLTLDVRFFVELRPTPANETLVSLASPTAEYDRLALDMYIELRQQMPVGVPVAMNAAGDWWRMATRKISMAANVVSPILSLVNPQAGAVVASAGAVSKQINTNLKKSQASNGAKKQVSQPANNLRRK